MNKVLKSMVVGIVKKNVFVYPILKAIEGSSVEYTFDGKEKEIYIQPYTYSLLEEMYDTNRFVKRSDDTGEYQSAKKLLDMSEDELLAFKEACKKIIIKGIEEI